MPTAEPAVNEARWITLKSAGQILCIGKDAVARQISAGRLTVRRLPGANPRVNEVEVRALAAAHTGRVVVVDKVGSSSSV